MCPGSDDADPARTLPFPQDEMTPSVSSDHEERSEADNVASHLDFQRLLRPSSSEYYYSHANQSNRVLLEKVKTKKASFRQPPPQARDALIDERVRASAYRGPAPTRLDGSVPRSALRNSKCKLPDEGASGAAHHRVKFTNVHIREYERVAGDNPCVTKGVPLSIGWGYLQHPGLDMVEYEVCRGPARDKIEMMVPAEVRREILRDEFGVSVADITAAAKEVTITKKHRKATLGAEPLEGWLEAAESTKRKFRRFVKRTTTAKEEEKVWAHARQNAVAAGRG